MPEVDLKDLEKIKIEKPEVTIGDDDVDDMLLSLRKQKATWEAVDRKSADGDRVIDRFRRQAQGRSVSGR